MARTLRVIRPINAPYDQAGNAIAIPVNSVDIIPFQSLRGIRIDVEIDEQRTTDAKTYINRLNLIADAISAIPVITAHADSGTPGLTSISFVLLGTLTKLENARIKKMQDDAAAIIHELHREPDDHIDVVYDWPFRDYDQ